MFAATVTAPVVGLIDKCGVAVEVKVTSEGITATPFNVSFENTIPTFVDVLATGIGPYASSIASIT